MKILLLAILTTMVVAKIRDSTGDVPSSRPCQTFRWPRRGRKNSLLWYEGGRGQVNGAQFCREEGFSDVRLVVADYRCQHNDYDDNDEYGPYYFWNGNAWENDGTPSANRCYVMIKAITCCNNCVRYDWPKRGTSPNKGLLWYEDGRATANAKQFCRERGRPFVDSNVPDSGCRHTRGDDNDESGPYYYWNGNAWVNDDTPSANRCYLMSKSITCCILAREVPDDPRYDTKNTPSRENPVGPRFENENMP